MKLCSAHGQDGETAAEAAVYVHGEEGNNENKADEYNLLKKARNRQNVGKGRGVFDNGKVDPFG